LSGACPVLAVELTLVPVVRMVRVRCEREALSQV